MRRRARSWIGPIAAGMSLAACGGGDSGGGGGGGGGGTPPVNYTLTISGSGSGSISSTPSGINCSLAAGSASGSCSASFGSGTSVALSATAASDWELASWSGAGCTGAGGCQVAMTQNQAVSAAFDRAGGPGLMKLSMTSGAANTGALILTITGGAVSSLTPASGLQSRTISAGPPIRVFLRGPIVAGVVADLQVVERKSTFTVAVQQAAAGAAGSYAVLAPTSYQVTVVRPP